jgi:hypothetical protein
VSSEPTPSPTPYQVIPSGRVAAELKALVKRAAATGFGHQALSALKEIERILRIYPQFGEPRRDLTMVGETAWAMTIPPLYVEYIIDELNRVVYIVIPFKALPNSGFE